MVEAAQGGRPVSRVQLHHERADSQRAGAGDTAALLHQQASLQTGQREDSIPTLVWSVRREGGGEGGGRRGSGIDE